MLYLHKKDNLILSNKKTKKSLLFLLVCYDFFKDGFEFTILKGERFNENCSNCKNHGLDF
jgi:hypothetical protein